MERLNLGQPHHDVVAEEGVGLARIAHQVERLVGDDQTVDDRPERCRVLRHVELKKIVAFISVLSDLTKYYKSFLTIICGVDISVIRFDGIYCLISVIRFG